MQKMNCPQCGKSFDTDEHEYCPHCSYGYWDDEDEFYDGVDEVGTYDVCPQCGGNIMVKVNSDGTQIENICEDCSYYSVDVE